MSEQIALAKQGNRKALSKLITTLEDQRPGARDIVARIYRRDLAALVIGITGVPGAGKSTFTSQLIAQYRARAQRVAVLAHDPSSSFTGGAILGDRVRMGGFVHDADVYIRSVASRGTLGGVASLTRDAIRLLDAVGFSVIIVETVGAGQLDIDVRNIADVNIVVMVPGTGDIVQASKAGIVEIGDLFIVNKADLPGADLALQELRRAMQLGAECKPGEDGWTPPVLKTNSIGGEGFAEVAKAIDDFAGYSRETGVFGQRRDTQERVEVIDKLNRLFWHEVTAGVVKKYEARITAGELDRDLDPYAAAEYLFVTIKEEIAAALPSPDAA